MANQPLDVLLLGSGGREHAIASSLSRSPRLGRLYAAPGNPGIAEVATCVALDPQDHDAVVAFCSEKGVGLVVVGPEAPLVDGLVDDLEAAGIPAFGPSKAAARLEGSKGFTKDFCARHNIPTAAYRRCESLDAARAYLAEVGAPIVVKADGLAAGKGVAVASTTAEAEAALAAIFGGAFGAAGASVVLEAVLEGEEASFFALCDGTRALPFASAQDHKRVGDGDTGPNTGGMGAYSPAPIVDTAMQARIMREIVEPTLAGMAAEGAPFKGVLFVGLMIGRAGPQLIEFNVRFGDPETQAMLPRLEDDLLELLLACAEGRMPTRPLRFSPDVGLCVVLAARGYPGTPAKGGVITGLADLDGVVVTQAGTRREGDRLVADGGRVLGITALGRDVAAARAVAYAAVDRIDWADGFCRRDIGARALTPVNY
ncbi:phosphoribosylglycinamide synthetase phosphoribosylamine-glycine ligase [Beijerinckiaceae bacterium RH AL1]|nr:phosphoribosylamine--glycine ligase [Beijerinckiaceae bacterium]VVB47332.1 phosphoribosylglycinamide synthetase phosphoribosylamine-glycine ligase [Beijerinckiaceae bacterium RH CH11]VVB47415.1 phosphoribosylglycinamide synthetase phosphoribosylamine-glycine ligase [Beijerinckiaceae bacterium RH AL8]VVC55834.1 phosphoribosylglycinamide synthetase phosphoribosylamine-glycine ligase [Beijerinckiaceae bacterium RH AL1]